MKVARTDDMLPCTPQLSVPSGSEGLVVTVVGIGNEFRSDDGVGLAVLRQLKENMPAGARAVELTGDQSYLLELMSSTEGMIIVDAAQSSAPAGTVFRMDVINEPLPEDFLPFSTHALDSVTAIELARALGSLPDSVLIYGIVGRSFEFGSNLTPEVDEAVEITCTRIIDDIGRIIALKNTGRRGSRIRQ